MTPIKAKKDYGDYFVPSAKKGSKKHSETYGESKEHWQSPSTPKSKTMMKNRPLKFELSENVLKESKSPKKSKVKQEKKKIGCSLEDMFQNSLKPPPGSGRSSAKTEDPNQGKKNTIGATGRSFSRDVGENCCWINR